MSFRIVPFSLLISLALTAQTPTTGTAQPGLSSFDTTMVNLMSTYAVPGAALAVVHGGQLVYARGFGYADTTTQALVQPDSLFRVASVTKPHTAAAILKLIERHQLALTDKAFSILSDLQPLPGYTEDPRVADITVQNLLEHKSGWYGEADGTGYDPLFDVDNIAQVAGVTPPADPQTIVRYMLGRPLDTTPGTYYSYSNFGYLVLGQIIAKVSGQSYESFVMANVTGPLGSTRTQFGASLTTLPGEVSYYPYPGEALTQSVFPGGGLVPFPNGGYSVEDNHANGGLVSSTIDLLRFLTSVNGSRGPQLFQTPVSGFPGYVPPAGPGWSWTFHGSLPGNNASLILLPDQTAICYLTNTRPANSDNFFNDFDGQLTADANAVTSWPGADLYSQYQTGFIAVQAADYLAVATAPDQFVTLLGTGLAPQTAFADTVPLPTTLGGVTASIVDSAGNTTDAPLDYVSPGQINLIIPSGLPTGAATVTIENGSATPLSTTIQIDSVSPGLFTANASGVGVPIALAAIYGANGSVTPETVFTCPAAYQCAPAPMSLGSSTDQLIVSLYGTGIRHNTGSVTATINGQPATVLYAGEQGQYAGLDQVNVQVPTALKGAGSVPVILTVDGRVSNTVTIAIQ